MKKWSVIVVVFVLFSEAAAAQTWSEWFKQRKTQIKYYLEQIGELQIYTKQAQKGYELVRDGLATIHQIKEGEFTLHNAFFTHLKQVNPSIRQFAGAAELVARQIESYKTAKTLLKQAQECGLFTPEEIALFQEAINRVGDDMALSLEELVRVTTNGKLEMTDDARLKRIEQLRIETARQEIDFRRMESSITQAAEQRWQQTSEINRLRKWHALP